MGSSNAYSSGVPPFSPGDALSASSLERMREADQRGLPQRSLGAMVRQTPNGTIVSPIQRRRSTAFHPFRVFDASDEDGLKVIVHYGSVINVTNWRNPQVIDPEIEGKSLIPDPESGERPRVTLPEEGEKVFVLLVISLNQTGQIEIPEDEEAPSPVTIEAYNEEELPDKLAQPNKVFIHIARLEIGETEGNDSERIIKRMDQILGSHVLWPQKVVHPFQVFDASDESGAKISIAYGAVIDMTDWQSPNIHVPKMNGEELPASIFGEIPKMSVSNGGGVYAVVKQGENGEISGDENAVEIQVLAELPEITDGTLYVQIAKLAVAGSGENQSVSIKQILGSHIVWPFKPDFFGWRHKKEDVPSALWLGSGSSYNEECDTLSDLFIQVQREDFDNGRDGDQVFMLRMEEEENVEFTLDKDNKRGLSFFISEDLTKLELDRKNTASPGIVLQSQEDETSLSIMGKGEGASIRSKAKEEECSTEMTSPEASISLKCEEQDPSINLESGDKSTKVTTVDGKQISMREITYMESPNSTKRAYFLCSEPEDEYNPGSHHSGHHSGEGHEGHGVHHGGHAIDPNHDSNHVGHGSHHAGHDAHHSDHHSGEDHEPEPHHTNHHAGEHTPV